MKRTGWYQKRVIADHNTFLDDARAIDCIKLNKGVKPVRLQDGTLLAPKQNCNKYYSAI